jgi:hypothetical protein
VSSHGAEAAWCEAREVEGAEASHRDPADRDAVGVGAEPLDSGRDRLVQHVRTPLAIPAIVVVARVTSVHEQDIGRERSERTQRLLQIEGEQVGRARAASVQQHKQRSMRAGPNRDLLEVSMEEAAVHGEPLGAGLSPSGATEQ